MSDPIVPKSTSMRIEERKELNAVGVFAFVASALALTLALFGALYAGSQTLGTSGVVRSAVIVGTYLTPILLGLLAIHYGNVSLVQIGERRQSERGDAYGIFAILMGMLTCVIAGIETFAFVVWPLVPAVG